MWEATQLALPFSRSSSPQRAVPSVNLPILGIRSSQRFHGADSAYHSRRDPHLCSPFFVILIHPVCNLYLPLFVVFFLYIFCHCCSLTYHSPHCFSPLTASCRVCIHVASVVLLLYSFAPLSTRHGCSSTGQSISIYLMKGYTSSSPPDGMTPIILYWLPMPVRSTSLSAALITCVLRPAD